MKKLIVLNLLVALSLLSCHRLDKKYKKLPKGVYADIQTNMGDIIVQLEYEKTPQTVGNFVSLAEGTNPRVTDSLKGKPFYDGLKFHRVISKVNGDLHDFMVQGGDPLGNGTGGPGYKFTNEFPRDSLDNLTLKHDSSGILSMANSGPGTNGSQFFITLVPSPHLDGKHTVFGHVVTGQNIVDSLIVNTKINKIKIVRIGRDARKFNAINAFENKFIKADKLKAEYLERINKYKENATETSSGLKFYFIKNGSGSKPRKGNNILVHYEVHFVDGTLLDTNYKMIAKRYGVYDVMRDKSRGYKPFPSKYSMEANLIQGFKEGLMHMRYGDKIVLFVPYHLAYGEHGGSGIPPKSDLIFEIEIYPNKQLDAE